MATPRARGGMSLTMSPPIRRSPLVCCSSPQMMRRNVVLPQPEGPSKTMNSPSGTSKVMPLTAGNAPNLLTMFLVDTAAIEPPRYSNRPAFPVAERGLRVDFLAERAESDGISGPRRKARSAMAHSASTGPFLHDDLALLRGPFDRVFCAQLTGRRFRHHVVENERVIDLVHRGRGWSRVTRNGGPPVRVL